MAEIRDELVFQLKVDSSGFAQAVKTAVTTAASGIGRSIDLSRSINTQSLGATVRQAVEKGARRARVRITPEIDLSGPLIPPRQISVPAPRPDFGRPRDVVRPEATQEIRTQVRLVRDLRSEIGALASIIPGGVFERITVIDPSQISQLRNLGNGFQTATQQLNAAAAAAAGLRTSVASIRAPSFEGTRFSGAPKLEIPVEDPKPPNFAAVRGGYRKVRYPATDHIPARSTWLLRF